MSSLCSKAHPVNTTPPCPLPTHKEACSTFLFSSPCKASSPPSFVLAYAYCHWSLQQKALFTSLQFTKRSDKSKLSVKDTLLCSNPTEGRGGVKKKPDWVIKLRQEKRKKRKFSVQKETTFRKRIFQEFRYTTVGLGQFWDFFFRGGSEVEPVFTCGEFQKMRSVVGEVSRQLPRVRFPERADAAMGTRPQQCGAAALTPALGVRTQQQSVTALGWEGNFDSFRPRVTRVIPFIGDMTGTCSGHGEPTAAGDSSWRPVCHGRE